MKIITCLVMALIMGNNVASEESTLYTIIDNAREEYYNKGQYEKCLSTIELAIKDHPGDRAVGPAKSLIASSYIKLQDYKKAKYILDTLQREYPEAKEQSLWEYQKAYIAYMERDFQEAIDKFKIYLKEWPDEKQAPYAFYYIARLYNKLQRYDLAIEYIEQLIDKYPNHSLKERAELILASCFLSNKQYDLATKSYEKYINDYKGSEQLDLVYYSLGRTYGDHYAASSEKLQQALEYYNKVIKVFSNSVWATAAHSKMGMIYYRMGNYQEAIGNFNKVIELMDPQKRAGGTLYYLGLSYNKIGELEKANKIFHRIIKDFPNSEWSERADKMISR